MAKAIVAAFFCVCALAQGYWGPGFNPFTPAHNVLYRVTGVPTPAAVARSAAAPAADKPKDD